MSPLQQLKAANFKMQKTGAGAIFYAEGGWPASGLGVRLSVIEELCAS